MIQVINADLGFCDRNLIRGMTWVELRVVGKSGKAKLFLQMFHCKPSLRLQMHVTSYVTLTNKLIFCPPLRTCDKCDDDADCNLNGVCDNGKCQCRKQDGVMYLGEHCEVQLKDECRTISNRDIDGSKVTYSADSAAAWIGENDIFQEYSRPMYTYVEGLSPERAPQKEDTIALVYTGSRYIITRLEQAKNNATSLYWEWQTKNFHGFW